MAISLAVAGCPDLNFQKDAQNILAKDLMAKQVNVNIHFFTQSEEGDKRQKQIKTENDEVFPSFPPVLLYWQSERGKQKPGLETYPVQGVLLTKTFLKLHKIFSGGHLQAHLHLHEAQRSQ